MTPAETRLSWTARLPDRKLKLFVVGVGLGFWLAWGAAAGLLAEGHPLAHHPACLAIDGMGLFWECPQGSRLQAVLSTAINAVLLVTLAMPAFVIAANIEPAVVPLAVPGVLFTAIGLPAGLFVLVRSLRRLFELALRR